MSMVTVMKRVLQYYQSVPDLSWVMVEQLESRECAAGMVKEDSWGRAEMGWLQ
jgi:hypothetical protein